MKKTVTILTGLLPVIYAGMLGLMVLVNPQDELMFALMGLYALLGLVAPLVFSAVTANGERRFLAVSNVWFYSANLLFFLAEIIFWLVRAEQNRIAEQNGAIEGGLGLVLLILIYLPHWISYLVTRLAGAVSCERSLRGICSDGVKALHAILQLFPGADLISALWVLRRIKTE